MVKKKRTPETYRSYLPLWSSSKQELTVFIWSKDCWEGRSGCSGLMVSVTAVDDEGGDVSKVSEVVGVVVMRW